MWLPDLTAREIKTSDGIEPLTMLTDTAAIAAMNNEGLPADTISVENGVIISSCTRWPLIIDPQLQGKYSSEGAAREWSTVVIVISDFYDLKCFFFFKFESLLCHYISVSLFLYLKTHTSKQVHFFNVM